jgi:hypothetical protein
MGRITRRKVFFRVISHSGRERDLPANFPLVPYFPSAKVTTWRADSSGLGVASLQFLILVLCYTIKVHHGVKMGF